MPTEILDSPSCVYMYGKYRYSQLPLLRTPSGSRVSVLNGESP